MLFFHDVFIKWNKASSHSIFPVLSSKNCTGINIDTSENHIFPHLNSVLKPGASVDGQTVNRPSNLLFFYNTAWNMLQPHWSPKLLKLWKKCQYFSFKQNSFIYFYYTSYLQCITNSTADALKHRKYSGMVFQFIYHNTFSKMEFFNKETIHHKNPA